MQRVSDVIGCGVKVGSLQNWLKSDSEFVVRAAEDTDTSLFPPAPHHSSRRTAHPALRYPRMLSAVARPARRCLQAVRPVVVLNRSATSSGPAYRPTSTPRVTLVAQISARTFSSSVAAREDSKLTAGEQKIMDKVLSQLEGASVQVQDVSGTHLVHFVVNI